MNKILLAILASLFAIVSTILVKEHLNNKYNDSHMNLYIKQRWNIEMPFYVLEDSIIEKNSDWHYIIIAITKKEMDKLLKIDLKKYGYNPWSTSLYASIGDIWLHEGNFVSSDAIIQKKGTRKAIFVDTKLDRFILQDTYW